jgi:hypothetical protein
MLDLGMQILKVLAVAGGTAVGWLGGGVLFRVLVRLSLQRSVPRKLLVPIRALGAATLGLAVWVWAFSSGGSGPGLGGWFGSGHAGGQSGVKTQPEPSAEATAQRPATAPKPAALEPQAGPGRDTLRIEILGGGRVKDERFYLLENENDPRTLTEVRKIIQLRRQDQDKIPLRGLVIMVYGSSVARDHPAVQTLVKWAEGNGLSVTFPLTGGSTP